MFNSKTMMARCKIADRRNSECLSAPLSRLDWQNWWMDYEVVKNEIGNVIGRNCYLHVMSKDGETTHRVFCKKNNFARVEYINGVAHWLYERKTL